MCLSFCDQCCPAELTVLFISPACMTCGSSLVADGCVSVLLQVQGSWCSRSGTSQWRTQWPARGLGWGACEVGTQTWREAAAEGVCRQEGAPCLGSSLHVPHAAAEGCLTWPHMAAEGCKGSTGEQGAPICSCAATACCRAIGQGRGRYQGASHARVPRQQPCLHATVASAGSQVLRGDTLDADKVEAGEGAPQQPAASVANGTAQPSTVGHPAGKAEAPAAPAAALGAAGIPGGPHVLQRDGRACQCLHTSMRRMPLTGHVSKRCWYSYTWVGMTGSGAR